MVIGRGGGCSAVAAAPTPHDWTLNPPASPTEDRPVHMEATDWPPNAPIGEARDRHLAPSYSPSAADTASLSSADGRELPGLSNPMRSWVNRTSRQMGTPPA